MRVSRVTPLALAGVIVFAACSDRSLPPTEADTRSAPPVGADLVDGRNSGNPGFYFLPPLASNPNPTGTFNASLSPSIELCELVDPTVGCAGGPVATFGGDAISVSSGAYQYGWDTDGPETPALDESRNYRLSVLVGNEVLGYLDVNPQNPSGSTPSADEPGLYAFRLGETIPVKFFIAEGVTCQGDQFVLECTEGNLGPQGGCLEITELGVDLGVCVPMGALDQTVLGIVERYDPPNGECLFGLDAPVYGPCLRIRTVPELTEPLNIPATVAICADVASFPGLLPGQDHNVQIHRQSEDRTELERIANVLSTLCEPDVGGTLVGMGLTRPAGALWNGLLDLITPSPVVAADQGLGGLTRYFSYFQWGLPCRLTAVSAQEQVGNAGALAGEAPAVECVDASGDPVDGATVHWEVTQGGGSFALDPDYQTVTDVHDGTSFQGQLSGAAADPATPVPAGRAGLLAWTLGSQGANAVEAWGVGLLGPDEAFDPHDGSEADPEVQYVATEGRITFAATAAGPPASINGSTTDYGQVTVGEPLPADLEVTVLDDGGTLSVQIGVPNVQVTFTVTSGNGSFGGDCAGLTTCVVTTDIDGVASVPYTVGTTAGSNVITASLADSPGVPAETFTVEGVAGPPAALNITGGDTQTGGLVGETLAEPLQVTLVDQYGNPVGSEPVSFSVSAGSGTLSTTSTTTAADGTASTVLTLGGVPGTVQVTATSGSFSRTFSFTAACRVGWGTASIDGTLGADEWACRVEYPFQANIGNTTANAVLYHMNDGQYLYLAVIVGATDRINRLRFDFDNDADGIPEVGNDGMDYDPVGRTFVDQFLTEKCTNSSQAGCGDLDVNGGGTADVGLAAGNPDAAFMTGGGQTIYELRKPLKSGDALDIAVDADNPAVQLFWTLRLGNGAKGNTQVPGFRNWYTFDIATLPR